MAFLAEAIPAIASFFSSYGPIISTAASVLGTLSRASAEREAAQRNAMIAAQRAEAERRLAKLSAERAKMDQERKLGAIRAAAGASGVGLAGSPIDVLSDVAAESVFDELTRQFEFESRARAAEAEAEVQRSRASSALTGGILSASAKLLAEPSVFGGSPTGAGKKPKPARPKLPGTELEAGL